MAKTKTQKQEAVKIGAKELKDAKFLLFADFSKVTNEELKSFRRLIRDINAKFSVVKKRLMGIILKNAGIDFNTKQFAGQMGTIFAKGDISDIAQAVYKFAKEKQNFKILGGLDVLKKEVLPRETVVAIGRLPAREVLLGQLLGGITGPVRKFMFALQEVGKKKGGVV